MPRRRWYHILMKLFCAFSLLAAAAFASVNPQLHEVKRVYILAMGSGMDQYLANQLTKAGLFEVVTDPKKADAIVTDNVGEAFQKKLDELYPPPPEAESRTGSDQARRRLRHARWMSATAPLTTPRLPRRTHWRTWILAAACSRSSSLGPRQGQLLRGGPK